MKLAVIGSGVSGLVLARLAHRAHELSVFEADARIGGHVHTWELESGDRSYAVDSGFIVYNELNYPRFTRLLAQLGVQTQPSSMSFSVSCARSGLEYNGSSLRQLFAQPRNALRPGFLRMLAEIARFNRDAPLAVRNGSAHVSLGEYLGAGRYSAAFREHYALPMAASIWSLPPARALELPAAFLVSFLENHGMLSLGERPTWRVIRGGSRRYADALVAPLRARVRCSTPVRRIERRAGAVLVDGERFDRVVLACHSDQALALLAEPTRAEREVLGALPYQPNEAVVHTDTALLPRSRRAWGAWNYRVQRDPARPACLTYDMNRLQSLAAPETFCVTLNPELAVDERRVRGRARYAHPVMTLAGMRARERRAEISGALGTHYCGAYWGNGFHEDGVASAQAVARELGLSTEIEA
jgi:predicted NAD/FAD-binding protein